MPARSDDVTHPPGTGALSGVPARSQRGVGTGDESPRCRGGSVAVEPSPLGAACSAARFPQRRCRDLPLPGSPLMGGRGILWARSPSPLRGVGFASRPGPAELRSALQRRSLGLSVSVSGGGLRRSVGTRGRDRRTWGGVEWGRGGGGRDTGVGRRNAELRRPGPAVPPPPPAAVSRCGGVCPECSAFIPSLCLVFFLPALLRSEHKRTPPSFVLTFLLCCGLLV